MILDPTGSAAERKDCDEILEINGESLETATHQEIIQYINQVSLFNTSLRNVFFLFIFVVPSSHYHTIKINLNY